MKKVLSIAVVAMVLVGLTGCMDDPDGSKQSTRNQPAKDSKTF